jgi:hypothetical protein
MESTKTNFQKRKEECIDKDEEEKPISMSKLEIGQIYKMIDLSYISNEFGETIVAKIEDRKGDTLKVYIPKRYNRFFMLYDEDEAEKNEIYILYMGINEKGSYRKIEMDIFDNREEAKKASKEFLLTREKINKVNKKKTVTKKLVFGKSKSEGDKSEGKKKRKKKIEKTEMEISESEEEDDEK